MALARHRSIFLHKKTVLERLGLRGNVAEKLGRK